MPEPRGQRTKTDRQMEDQMLSAAGDDERVAALQAARSFKRSWIELAEVLVRVRDGEAWQRWGHESFDDYCGKELHLKPATVAKLVGTYSFLRSEAPRVIERTRRDTSAAVPSLQSVDFVARAERRGAADADTMREIRHAAFDEGAEAPLLTRRFKAVAFPIDAGERDDKVRQQIVSTARRLANLLAEPASPVTRNLAMAVEASLGELISSLED